MAYSALGKRGYEDETYFHQAYKHVREDYVDPFELMMASARTQRDELNTSGSDMGDRASCAFCEKRVPTDGLHQCDHCQEVFCRDCSVPNYEGRDETWYCFDCNSDSTRGRAPGYGLPSPVTPAGPIEIPQHAAHTPSVARLPSGGSSQHRTPFVHTHYHTGSTHYPAQQQGSVSILPSPSGTYAVSYGAQHGAAASPFVPSPPTAAPAFGRGGNFNPASASAYHSAAYTPVRPAGGHPPKPHGHHPFGAAYSPSGGVGATVGGSWGDAMEGDVWE